MSDFDTVLERLLVDPSFQAALAADPAAALAGYHLGADEADLLRRQFSSETGGQAAVVEDRVTKSSTFGLFASFGAGELLGPGGGAGTREGFGAAPVTGTGPAGPATEGFGAAPDLRGAGGGEVPVRTGLGSAPGQDGAGRAGVSALGNAPRSGFGEPGTARTGLGEPEHLAPPKGYHNRVDADGDGTLDKATYRGRAGGGAEIRVDLDGDGRADFVGVDEDLDNRVDFADYDKDHDGVFEKRMVDDDGDGYLDRRTRG